MPARAAPVRSIPLDPSPDGDVIHREPTLDQKLLDVAVQSEKRKYQPIARRMTCGSNWRHLNRPQTEESRRSIHQPITAGLQSCTLASLFRYSRQHDIRTNRGFDGHSHVRALGLAFLRRGQPADQQPDESANLGRASNPRPNHLRRAE
jgi:hypothetical protein